MRKWIAFFLILASSVFAVAADMGPVKRACSTIDLRKFVGPVRNQGNMGWCYANAAADLLGFHFRSELRNQPVSAISVALEFNSKQRDKHVLDEGGNSDVAIRTYLGSFGAKDSLCLQKAEDLILGRGLDVTLQEKLQAMQKLKRSYDAARSDPRLWKQFGQYWHELKTKDSVLFVLPEDTLRNILFYSTAETFPLKLKAEFCRGRSISVDSSRVAVRQLSLSPWLPFLTADELVSTLDQQIAKENIVSISYRASFITTANGALDEKTGHASVVVGRKWNDEKNRCEYLVRNSWGSGCAGYENKNVRCEDGHFWISAGDLEKTMYGLTYLEAGIGLKWFRSMLSSLQ